MKEFRNFFLQLIGDLEMYEERQSKVREREKRERERGESERVRE